MLRVGSRAQVMHGTAKQTSGGLTKKDLKYNKYGKIVSKKMSQLAKKEKRLEKAGYKTEKGVFGSKKIGGIPQLNFQLPFINRRLGIKNVQKLENKYDAIKSLGINEVYQSNPLFEEFINGLHKNGTKIEIKTRTGDVNPNNEIYIDQENKKVYKFGLWDDSFRSIRNEFISYSILTQRTNNQGKKHFPKLYGCELIPDTKYALLVIEFKDNLIPFNVHNTNMNDNHWNMSNNSMNISNNSIKINNMNKINNNNKKKLKDETIKFLKDNGIINEDIDGNLYYYKDEMGNSIFYCIDFEEVKFIDPNNKLKLTSNINKLHLTTNNRNKIESFNAKCKKKPINENKKRNMSGMPSMSLFNNSNNNNNNNNI